MLSLEKAVPFMTTMRESSGVGGGQGVLSLNNHKAIGFFSNTGPEPLKSHKATKPVFNVGPSSPWQRNTVLMAFHCWTDDCPLLVVFGSSPPPSHQL